MSTGAHKFSFSITINMFANLVLCLVTFIVLGIVKIHNVSGFREENWPFDSSSPFPYRTPSPISFESKCVRFVNFPTPINITIGELEPFWVTNTGCSVIAKSQKPGITSISGGVFGSSVYILQGYTYFWSEDYMSPAASGIDGERPPLFVRSVWRNKKYPNDAVANKFRDGFNILQDNIKVEGYTPNPRFERFSKLLKCIRKAGSSTLSPLGSLYIWFDELTFNKYYSYPGSNYEGFGFNRTEYDSATIFQVPKSYNAYISIPQFEGFLKLRNYAGNTYTNKLIAYPADKRPIIEGCGVRQYIFQTAI